MEMSFSELKRKEVINTADGRRLGRVCDIVFYYPENKITGIVVPGCRSFFFKKSEQFIPLSKIVKIGDDVILVDFSAQQKPLFGGGIKGCNSSFYSCCSQSTENQRRNYDDYE